MQGRWNKGDVEETPNEAPGQLVLSCYRSADLHYHVAATLNASVRFVKGDGRDYPLSAKNCPWHLLQIYTSNLGCGRSENTV